MSALSTIEAAKKVAAFQAVKEHLDPSFRFVGIGSGSTVVYVVEAIVEKGPDFYSQMKFIPTSSQSKGLITAGGLPICHLDERPLDVRGSPVPLDVAFDGADQVDKDLNCIKGGGACLFQEKLVIAAAKKFVLVADYTKLATRLCTNGRTLPLEVLPVSAPDVQSHLRALGCPSSAVRGGVPGKAGECVTDNGMWIIDAKFPPLLLPIDLKAQTPESATPSTWEVSALARTLCKIPGIVETGLFCNLDAEAFKLGHQWLVQKPVAAYFGMSDGEVHIVR